MPREGARGREGETKRRVSIRPGLVAATLATVLAVTQPATAITNGVPDSEGRYPMVGISVLEVGGRSVLSAPAR